MRTNSKSVETAESTPISVAKRRGRPKKSNGNSSASTAVSNSLMTVSGLQRSKIAVVETIIDSHSLYLRPPSLAVADEIHSSESNIESAKIVARYLARNLFNDEEGKNPVGTEAEFKEGFNVGELIDLFQRLNEGIVLLKKKVN